MLTIYPACFFKEENGYSVIFPDLENGLLATCGADLEEAIRMSVDCLAGYIHTAQMLGENLPSASELREVDINKVATAVYEKDDDYIDAFVNMVSVDVELYAKEHFEKSVKKTLTIPVWLNDLAMECNINFSQVLQEALIAKVRRERL